MVGDTGFVIPVQPAVADSTERPRLSLSHSQSSRLALPVVAPLPTQISVSRPELSMPANDNAPSVAGGGLKMVGHIFSSWHRVGPWLHHTDRLRMATLSIATKHR